MKNTPWRSVIFIFIISILLSCAPYSVRYYEKPIGKMEEITLISTMIGKPELSPLPLLDAPFFNAKVRSKANEIIELQKKVIDQYRETVASNLEKKLRIKVKYGSQLHSIPEYIDLKDKYNFSDSLSTEDEYFSKIIIASGDINPFKFNKGDVKGFFNEESNYKSVISEITKALNTDLVAVSYSYFFSWPGPFGVWGSITLHTHIYIFNREGELVFSGHGWSPSVITSGTNIEHYQQVFDFFPSVLQPIIGDIANTLKR